MDHPTTGTTLCARCSLLKFNDLATRCRVIDKEGVGLLSFNDVKMKWRPRYYQEWNSKSRRRTWSTDDYFLTRLRWQLDDSLPDMPQLSNSSQSGCDFCSVLYLSLKKYFAEQSKYNLTLDVPITLTAYLSNRGLRSDGMKRLQLDGDTGVKVDGTSHWQADVEGIVVEGVFNETEDEEKRAIVYFPMEASPGKSSHSLLVCSKVDYFQGCQEWLGAEPVRHHSYLTPESTSEICRVLAECTARCHPWKASFLPTRLLDIGTSSSDIPRLILSSEDLITAETKYAALSYCWGDKEDAQTQLKTETASLEQRLKGIPCEKMTPAIKDAVELTRAIGLQYIWIDALCIIQDDTVDWSYESGQMNSVYHHAFVTFCGLASTSCHKSFLHRAPTVSIPFQSKLRPLISGYLSLRLQPLSGEWRDRRIYTVDRSTSRWSERAWTYQEEELSTRRLFFGGSRMHFLCGTHKWSEGDDGLHPLDETSLLLHDRITAIDRGELPVDSLYETWKLVVHNYSHRSITRTTDRLPAISGLARLVWETLGDDYVAGFWKGDIIGGLAWSGCPDSYGLQNHLQSIRERDYVAPSWSWAACTGGGYMHIRDGWPTMLECTLLDVDVKVDLQNPFGRVFSGHLQIRGHMAPIPPGLRKRRRDKEWSADWWLFGEDDLPHIVAWLDWLRREEDEDEGLENLVVLLLHCQRFSSPDTGVLNSKRARRERDLSALILYPTNIPGEYYRVGMVQSTRQSGHTALRAWFEERGHYKMCTIV